MCRSYGASGIQSSKFYNHFVLNGTNDSKELAAGEGVEPSSSGSKPDMLPVTPSRRRGFKFSGSKFQVRLSTNLKPETWNLKLEVVDPTGLKPAPHGLKGRRSVTRAPGQQHSSFEF